MDRDHIFAEIVNSTWMLYAMRARNDRWCEPAAPSSMTGSANTVLAPTGGFRHRDGPHGDVGWAFQELATRGQKGLRSVIINCDTRPNWNTTR